MNARLWWLVGGFAVVAAAFVYSRTQAGSESVSTLLGETMNTISNTVRGIRNNNPTNMMDAGIHWEGMIGTDADGFLRFDTMVNGIRAAAKDLANMSQLHGIDTVDAAIRRWSKTDQDAYVANVSAALNVDPHDAIDLTDDNTRQIIIRAMTVQENGAIAAALIPDSIIVQGVSLA